MSIASIASIASSQQSFLIPTTHTLTTHKPRKWVSSNSATFIRCRCQSSSDGTGSSQQDVPSSTSRKMSEKQLAKLAVVTLAAGVLALGSVGVGVGDALAAKSGGRVGGQAFRSSAPRPNSSPRPRVNNNSRTNIYINPPVAPPLGGYGYGYGSPFFGGWGWGWSPFSFFAPGPSVAVGIGGGFDSIALFLFLGAAAAVVRRFTRSRNEEDDDDY